MGKGWGRDGVSAKRLTEIEFGVKRSAKCSGRISKERFMSWWADDSYQRSLKVSTWEVILEINFCALEGRVSVVEASIGRIGDVEIGNKTLRSYLRIIKSCNWCDGCQGRESEGGRGWKGGLLEGHCREGIFKAEFGPDPEKSLEVRAKVDLTQWWLCGLC